jgi:homoserine kinase
MAPFFGESEHLQTANARSILPNNSDSEKITNQVSSANLQRRE